MKRTNVIATPSTPLRKDVRHYRRYSNATPFVDLGVGGDYSDVTTHETFTYNQGGGSGTFNWGGFINNLLDSGTTIVTSIFGKDNKWQVEGLNAQLEAERKTNTILWVVIGLVLALIIFLVVRKTK